MKQAFTQMLTGKDNFSVDLFRVLVCLSVPVFLGLACVSVIWPEHKFDMSGFGTGLGLVLVAAAGALKIKETTEPGSTPGVTSTATQTTVTEMSTS